MSSCHFGRSGDKQTKGAVTSSPTDRVFNVRLSQANNGEIVMQYL